MATIRMNPFQSETKFSIQINLYQSKLTLIQTDFSIRINPNESDAGMIRINFDWKFDLDQFEFGLITDWKLSFGLVRIHSDCCFGLNRIRSYRFFTVFHQTSYKTFFGLVRIGSDTDIGMNRNDCFGMNSYPILSPGQQTILETFSDWLGVVRNEFPSEAFARVPNLKLDIYIIRLGFLNLVPISS